MGWLRRKREFVEPTAPARLLDTNGWEPVLHPLYGGYHPSFDPARRYEFGRLDSDRTSFFRLADQGGWFNIAGLYWRPPTR